MFPYKIGLSLAFAAICGLVFARHLLVRIASALALLIYISFWIYQAIEQQNMGILFFPGLMVVLTLVLQSIKNMGDQL